MNRKRVKNKYIREIIDLDSSVLYTRNYLVLPVDHPALLVYKMKYPNSNLESVNGKNKEVMVPKDIGIECLKIARDDLELKQRRKEIRKHKDSLSNSSSDDSSNSYERQFCRTKQSHHGSCYQRRSTCNTCYSSDEDTLSSDDDIYDQSRANIRVNAFIHEMLDNNSVQNGPQINENNKSEPQKEEKGVIVPDAMDNEPFIKDNEKECTICYERSVKTAIVDCGHSCLCITCSRKIGQTADASCPMCRIKVTRIIRLY